MKTETQSLMKHFASVLRARALGKLKAPSIDNSVARHFSRKQLIEIVQKRFDGTIPKEHNLVELENEELLELIGDEMFIISYVTEIWSKEASEKPDKKGVIPAKEKVEVVTKKTTPATAKK